MLPECSDRDMILPWIVDGVSVHDFPSLDVRGPSISVLFRREAFPGRALQDRVPEKFQEFAGNEVTALVGKGCPRRWDELRTPGAPG